MGVQKEKNDGSDSKCPAQCREIESHSHYLVCSNKEMKINRQQEAKKLMNKLEKKQTYPGIRSATQAILLNGIDEAISRH